MRSIALVVAVVLSLAPFTVARVATKQQDSSPNLPRNIANLLKGFFRLEARQQVCVEDDLYQKVQNYSGNQDFCSLYLNDPPATVVVDYTPTVTDSSTFTTVTDTVTQVVRTGPVSTVTTTITSSPAKLRRDASPAGAVRMVGQELASNMSTSYDPSFQQQLSSACSCLPVTEFSTTTATYTADPTHVTQLAYVHTVQTVNATAAGRASVTTVTVVDVASASSSSSSGSASGTVAASSTSSAAPTPISPTFSCPSENNVTVNQLVDDQLYDYLVLCSTSLSDENLASYTYSTLDQCAAACSRADNYFGTAVCQATVFETSVSSGQPNCFLKLSGNSTVASPDSNAVILLRISLAVTDTNTTSSSSAGFASSSSLPMNTASAMSSVFADSSSSMPLITPAPSPSGRLPGDAAVTSYSTFFANGSTYSTGVVYSTYYTSDGVWYESYYTSYSVAWAASTTIEGSAESTSVSTVLGYNVSSASESGEGQISSENITTTYVVGGTEFRNETIITDYLYPNGTLEEIITTDTKQIQVGGDEGGAIASTSSSLANTTTTTVIVTEYNTTTVSNTTVISGASGNSSSGSSEVSSTLVFSTQYSTAYATTVENAGYKSASSTLISGSILPSSNASTPASNVPASITESVFSTAFVSTLVSSGSTGGASSFLLSGSINASSTAASGISPSFTELPRSGTESSPSAINITSVFSTGYSTVLSTTYGSSGASGFVLSGLIGTSGTAASGSIVPTANLTSPVAFTEAPRSGTLIPTVSPSGSVTLPVNSSASFTEAPRSGTVSPIVSPSGSITLPGNSSVSFTEAPRSGTQIPAFSPSGVSSYPISGSIINMTTPLGPTGTGSTRLPSFTEAPRSGTESPTPAGTAPSVGFPIPKLNSSSGIYTGLPLTTGTGSGPSPTINITLAGTSPLSNTAAPRSGTYSTSPTPSLPGSNYTICSMPTMATTTLWSTLTMYGCAESCTSFSSSTPSSILFSLSSPITSSTPSTSSAAAGHGGGYGSFGGYEDNYRE